MKKFYSLVLMAAALLVSTNAWAVTRTASDATSFENAWKAAQNNDTIQLTDNIDLNKTFWLGTMDMNGTPKSITLDLNGHKIVTDGVTIQKLFFISHGELIVTGTGEIIQQGSSDKSAFEIFRVSGSTYKNVDPKAVESGFYSHLVIGENVTLTAKANAVVIDQMTWPMTDAAKSVRADGVAGNLTTSLPAALNTSVYGHGTKDGKQLENNYGLANGARIDVYGTIRAHKYAIKANGNLGSPTMRAAANLATKPYYSNPAQTVIYTKEETDTQYTPFIYIHKTADLRTLDVNATYSIAAYSGGYARWMVEGTCIGSTGVYVKSGEIVLNDATVASNFEGTYVAADSARNSGVDAGGSGIVMESSTAYAGDIAVTVQGDTKVTGTSGYAIDESITAANDSTKVDAITITGGTFVSGAQGTMHVTETTVEANADPTQETIITIIGGQTTGSTTPDSIGNQTLAEFLGTQSTTTHVTVVEDENGKQVVVISEGSAPAIANSVSGAIESTVDWQNTGATKDTIKADKVLDELTINQNYEQTLVINSGKKLTVGRVILGKDARIIVEAGGELIVTGDQGIVAPSVDNVVLRTSETAQATFLFKPSVTSNRHPNATVKLLAQQIGYMTVGSTKYWFWNRFALPIKKATSWSKSPDVTSYVYKWSYEEDDWKSISALTDMEPFKGYILTANQETLGDVEYTFRGELAGGNESAALQFARNGFHFFGNSYTGHISVDKLVEQIMGASDIDGTVWVWGNDQNYHAIPLMALRNNPAAFPYDWQKEIAPMQTFVLKHNVNATGSTELNYATAVWGNPRYNSFNGNAAPRRHVADETTHMNIVITAENGKSDFVMFMEDGLCSDEYDNGYDGAKYMNEEALNMYSSVNGANYSVVATDNIEGKMLTINTVNDVNYTMTFANVNGEEYAIRDNVTGAVIAVEEGASYEFAAQPNSVAEGRFEIVKVSKVATDIENTEVKANAKGIYTIMGQYVGEDFEALPAGIYVVNGVKIVK